MLASLMVDAGTSAWFVRQTPTWPHHVGAPRAHFGGQEGGGCGYQGEAMTQPQKFHSVCATPHSAWWPRGRTHPLVAGEGNVPEVLLWPPLENTVCHAHQPWAQGGQSIPKAAPAMPGRPQAPSKSCVSHSSYLSSSDDSEHLPDSWALRPPKPLKSKPL